MNTIRACLVSLVAVGFLAALAGCRWNASLEVAELRVERTSWDTLAVSTTFRLNPLVGGTENVQPDSVMVTLFRASYDTLYRGSPGTIAIDDTGLLNRERLLVDVCGFHAAGTACDQYAVSASPKRMIPQADIAFPTEDRGYERGSYTLRYTLHRQRFGTDDWEPLLRSSRTETVLSIRVAGSSNPSVEIPVKQGDNRLILARQDNFRLLRYDIQSAMLDADSAAVVFDLRARLGQTLESVAIDTVVVRSKSTLERREEVARLVELAGEKILDELKGRFGLRRAYVFIDEWSYEPLDRMYVATIDLQWQDGLRSNWSDLSAQVSVRFDGTMGQVVLLGASEGARERWDRAYGTSTMFLEPLYDTP
ncbi:MAG: hypothetical protein RIE53_06400 [Rhodothermales bacterium]